MMVMPANNKSGFVHYWSGRAPGMVGHIWSLTIKKGQLSCLPPTFYEWIPYAIDNGRFICWDKGVPWSAEPFLQLLKLCSESSYPPLWVVVPDVRLNAVATLQEWEKWEPVLRQYGFPLAIAIQDGMELSDIPKFADVIFVGGSDDWRYPRLKQLVALGKPVHVGRVNHKKHLWWCHFAGVTSCDGSGWFRGDRQQLSELEFYLKFKAGEIKQLPLEYERYKQQIDSLSTAAQLALTL